MTVLQRRGERGGIRGGEMKGEVNKKGLNNDGSERKEMEGGKGGVHEKGLDMIEAKGRKRVG